MYPVKEIITSVGLFSLQASASSIEERISMVQLDVSSDASVEKASDQVRFDDVRKWSYCPYCRQPLKLRTREFDCMALSTMRVLLAVHLTKSCKYGLALNSAKEMN